MKPTLAIFIHEPQCETACALGMINGLVKDFDIRTFGLDELSLPFLREFDAVCFPGGMGNADDFDDIFTLDHIVAVQVYVAEGGKYFGICMGAYWAGSNYFDLVTDLTIGQYIERPTSDIDYDGPTVADVVFPNNMASQETMYFYDGCAILGTDMQVVAHYQNGDAMAAIQDNVGMFGCHPEALEWWYTEGDMDDSWYTPKHAHLMRDFVHQLLAN
jgi:glutamine amidotransferase-like uncharacterized protein